MRHRLSVWRLINRWWLRAPKPVARGEVSLLWSAETRALETWQVEPCWRCGACHPRHCDLCSNDPPCADHVCSWSDEEDEDEDEEVTGTCPGVELKPNPCTCTCYGCRHHCGAHWGDGDGDVTVETRMRWP